MPTAEPHLSYAPMRYFRAIIPSIASLIVWPFFFQLVLSEFRTTKKLICSFFLNVGRRSEEKIRQVGRHKAASSCKQGVIGDVRSGWRVNMLLQVDPILQ